MMNVLLKPSILSNWVDPPIVDENIGARSRLTATESS